MSGDPSGAPSGSTYGADYRGFVAAFWRGFYGQSMSRELLDTPEGREVLRAATDAYSDALIRRRRADRPKAETGVPA